MYPFNLSNSCDSRADIRLSPTELVYRLVIFRNTQETSWSKLRTLFLRHTLRFGLVLYERVGYWEQSNGNHKRQGGNMARSEYYREPDYPLEVRSHTKQKDCFDVTTTQVPHIQPCVRSTTPFQDISIGGEKTSMLCA